MVDAAEATRAGMTIEDVLASRTSRLDRAHLDVVELLAVAGGPVSREVIARAVDARRSCRT